jgi:hypothetical protein
MDVPGRASLLTGAPTKLDEVFTKLRPPPRAAAAAAAIEVGRRARGFRRATPSTCEMLCELIARTDEGGMLVKHFSSHGDIARLRCSSKVVRAVVDQANHLVGLLRRDVHLQPHQLADIFHMCAAEDPPGWTFGDLRGGVLADAPGLGKTVTMVALILSSSGTLPKTPSTFWDATRLAEGWAAMLRNRISRQECTPLLVRLQQAQCTVPPQVSPRQRTEQASTVRCRSTPALPTLIDSMCLCCDPPAHSS